MADTFPNPRFFALIPSAGMGARAGAGEPKQYRWLAGQAMVWHTLGAFRRVPCVLQTLVVVAPGDTFFKAYEGLPPDANLAIAHCGGDTRARSVRNGLQALADRGALAWDWVLVHDAARCLITPEAIQRLIDACVEDPVGGLLAHHLPDTLKRESEGRVAETIDRSDKWLAQTPQMFRLGALMAAYDLAGLQVTDEASAIEGTGHKPLLVPGEAQNFKVTYPDDFAVAEAILLGRT